MRRVLGAALVAAAFLLLSWPARAESGDVQIQDNFYAPTEVTILIGESVTWTSAGNNAHTVTSDAVFDSSPDCPGAVDPLHQCMHKGDKFSLTFNTAGRFSYHCKVHGDAMSGTVIVESSSSDTTTTSTTSRSSTTSSSSSSSSSSSGSSPASSASSSDSSSLSQAPPPTFTSTTRVVLPKAVTVRSSSSKDDATPWALADIFIAGTTTLVGVVLVRKGRVPFG
jgi:plastocyanin